VQKVVEPEVKPEEPGMQLVMKESNERPAAYQPPAPMPSFEDDSMDEVEEQKKRAAERIQKLRNLSFNMNNAADANNEFDAVPAYVRRNMELFGSTLTSVENFYSKYTVSKDENDQTQISTINTFLDGKKPD
jgi:cell division protein FtsZ